MKTKYSLLIICILILMTSCTTNTIQPHLVDSDEFERLMAQENVFLLNTHTPYEGDIEGTDATIEDWENIALHQDVLPENKDAMILLYCRSGRMSESSAQQLVDLGYKNVYDLDGGFKAWKASGRELIYKN
ncbi:rhodanese-like domain-containing protein [Candidatus Woesearchaeota archaeon]|nr:rhodanese-like domain-containing protein [Candidatus Woesearchaeota archaeon]MBT3537149.1 rhodanese-like domain-containing protein [Candidatus Woesearchaeota archaeon]MBT4697724.1 rhodanese-like domain-containing protein [Candidatus Woesearchaeota archaeon]MBT7106541.1 rhodanese-like domain-containing protein [Candidatus Woesearchaeota archaeon]MBT7931084.1 rhodanese-like domain-containing protein [Candidatus Woesearchaeota archaeon]